MREEAAKHKPSDWKYSGEVDSGARPVNSLVGAEVEYERSKGVAKASEKEESNILRLLKQRIREHVFDNFEYCVAKAPEQKVCMVEQKVEGNAEVDGNEAEELFLAIKRDLDVLTNISGVWYGADITVYDEKRDVVGKAKKTGAKTGKRDAASMRVLKSARNVKIFK